MRLIDQKITILGLGRHGGGMAAARYCAARGGEVTVTDLADEHVLATSLKALGDSMLFRLALGGHREDDFRDADLVVVNPAVRPDNHFVELARHSGARIVSEIELFLDECPATVIAVTGTVGKSTTAAILHTIFTAAGRRAWLGGNIGRSLLPDLPRIQASDVVVLELSSFQIHWLSDQARWPQGVVITNCSPNHLDWHGTWAHYVAAKKRLLLNLPTAGFSVINTGDTEVASWIELARAHGKVIELWLQQSIPGLKIPGEHNRTNAACAVAAAAEFGVTESAVRDALANFTGLSHRLQFVAEISGRRFYNDSKATTPAATMAALASMDRPTWLLLGGAEKEIDLSDLAAQTARRARGAAVFGAVSQALEAHLNCTDKAFACLQTENLDAALRWCWRQSQPGDAILLSPACASTDQFRDYAHRGELFEQLVRELEN